MISGSVDELIASAGVSPDQTDWQLLDCTPTSLRLSNPIGEWRFTRD